MTDFEVEKLKELLNYHRYLYHAKDDPEISDYAYDNLMNKLKAWEEENPERITSDSPSQLVGYKVF